MKTQKSYTVDEATRAMEHFCSYQERCHQEVEKKLKTLRMIPEAQEVIILHLLQGNFLNEERFSRSYARGKFYYKKWGKRRIIRELKFRKISTYNINQALSEINDNDYMDTIAELLEKKHALLKETNPFKRKRKLLDHLLQKGYESDLVYRALENLKY